jgi:biopolymer transport protein ExbD
MRIKSRGAETLDIDMTPMIDMTFQLIAFFMILINFDASEQDERIQLPSSQLAKPPEAPLEAPITIQLTKRGEVIVGGQSYANPDAIKPILNNERYVLESQDRSAASATIVIRAHKDAKTGLVQNLIKVCQQAEFEKFTLRAKEDVGNN